MDATFLLAKALGGVANSKRFSEVLYHTAAERRPGNLVVCIEPGTMELARVSNKLAATRSLTGWRISFTLREFPPKDNMDPWFVFPLLVPDDTELLADCKPNFGGRHNSLRSPGLHRVPQGHEYRGLCGFRCYVAYAPFPPTEGALVARYAT